MRTTATVIGIIGALCWLLSGCGGSGGQHLSTEQRSALIAQFSDNYPSIEALVSEGRAPAPLPATAADLARQLTYLPADAKDAALIQYWSALFAVAGRTRQERSEAGYTLGFITEPMVEDVCRHAPDDAFATFFLAIHDRSPAITGAGPDDSNADTSKEGLTEVTGALNEATRPGGSAVVRHLSGSSARLDSATNVIDGLYDIIAGHTMSPVGPQFAAGRSAARKALGQAPSVGGEC